MRQGASSFSSLAAFCEENPHLPFACPDNHDDEGGGDEGDEEDVDDDTDGGGDDGDDDGDGDGGGGGDGDGGGDDDGDGDGGVSGLRTTDHLTTVGGGWLEGVFV